MLPTLLADGALTFHAIRIEHVPRRWRERRADDASPSHVQPAEPLVPEFHRITDRRDDGPDQAIGSRPASTFATFSSP